LDGKHTVFGKVVGGLDTLHAMERIEVDNKDVPIEDIVIEKAQVFVDPYQEADEQLAAERVEEERRRAEEEKLKKEPKRDINAPLKVFRSGIGKYIDMGESSKYVDLSFVGDFVKKSIS
jgi:peptidyl-prolyl cis-trans isomerase-like 2